MIRSIRVLLNSMGFYQGCAKSVDRNSVPGCCREEEGSLEFHGILGVSVMRNNA